MSGDYTRFTFDPLRDYSRVRAQQGRVLLDADVNELVDGLDHRLRALALDVLGPCTAPLDLDSSPPSSTGFLIEPGGTTFTIGLGRLYLHGLELDNHGGAPLHLEPGLDDERGAAPVPYEQQPYYPDPPAISAGQHVVYVDAWDREVTAVENPLLIDSGVGVDTAARMQTVWQVKVVPETGKGLTCATPDGEVPGYAEATAPSAGRLSNATVAVPGSDDPCSVTPDGGYLGWDNRLYRVEVHTGGPLGGATFTWSRDNASIATAVLDIDSTRRLLYVARTGHDDVQRITEGSWVEILDDDHELSGTPGYMATVAAVDAVDAMTQQVTLSAPLPADFDPTTADRRTRLRQWDQSLSVGADGTIAVADATSGFVLEDGVQVTFSDDPAGGDLHTGDYWTFAARSADASLQPLDTAPPEGPIHFYGRLAVIDLPNGATDCRGQWPPTCGESDECACTVCVTPESHASGRLTIQMAVTEVGARGGTVCLEPGRYELKTPVLVDGAQSLTVHGSGWLSVLIYRGSGPAIIVNDGRGIRFEDFTVVFDSAVGAKEHDSKVGNIGVLVTMTVGMELCRCVVLDVGIVALVAPATSALTNPDESLWSNPLTEVAHSIAVAPLGLVVGLSIRDCVLAAGTGVGPAYRALGGEASLTHVSVTGLRDYLLLAGLDMERSVALGVVEAVYADERTILFGSAELSDSILASYSGAAVAWGAHPVAALMRVDRCVAFGREAGIVVGASGTVVSATRVVTRGTLAGTAGILLTDATAKGILEDVEISECRITCGVSAITLGGLCTDVVVRDNRLLGGSGGLVMGGEARAERLVVSGNDIALQPSSSSSNTTKAPRIRAGVWLVAAKDTEVHDNRFHDLADDSRTNTVGVFAEDCVSVVVSDNQITGLVLGLGDNVGILAFPAAYRFDVIDNVIDVGGGSIDVYKEPSLRLGIWLQSLDNETQWGALTARAVGSESMSRKQSAPHGFDAPIDASTATYAVVENEFVRFNDVGLTVRPLTPDPAATVRGNRLDLNGPATGIAATVGGPLLVSDNRVFQRGTLDDQQVGRGVVCNADSLVASANHVQAAGESFVIEVDPARLSVIGNVTSSIITVGGAPIDLPWSPLNVVLS